MIKMPDDLVNKPSPHQSLSNELASSMSNTLFEYWWRLVGRIFAKILRRNEPSFWLRVASFNLVILIVSLVINLTAHGQVVLPDLTRDVIWAAFTFLAVIVMRHQFTNQMEGFRNEILPAIHEDHLADIKRWSRSLSNLPQQIGLTVFFSLTGVSIIALSIPGGFQLSPGSLVGYFCDFAQLAMLIFLVFPFFNLYARIGNFRMALYCLNPAQSPVLIRSYKLTMGLSFAYTCLGSLFLLLYLVLFWESKILVISAFLIDGISWVPIIIFFGLSQRSFTKIIARAKSEKVASLQMKIMAFEDNADITNHETMETIHWLMEFYQSTISSPNSMLNTQTLLGMANSLLLPLLGLVLGNYRIILNLFGIQIK